MWHKIWDSAVGFHKRYIRPVWNRAPYSKLKETCEDCEADMSSGANYASITDNTGGNETANVSRVDNKTPNSSVSSMSTRSGFDYTDAGFQRSVIPNIKDALPSKSPSYQHIPDETDRIEVSSGKDYQSLNFESRNNSKNKASSDLSKLPSDMEVTVEEIIPPSPGMIKKSRRRKIKKQVGHRARVSMQILKEAFIIGFTPPAPCLYVSGS
ncbi:uncharacterized protein LOC115217382 isoform X1 [Argonauta hians]